MDEPRAQRQRRSDRAERIDRALGDCSDRKQVLVGRVVNAGSMPSSALRYYAVRPLSIAGTEVEGAIGGQDVASSAQELVLVLGPKIPVVGDDLIAHAVGDRWVAGRGGGCPGSPSLTITVFGCLGLRLQGATVTCNGTSKVTDAQGLVSFPVTANGTYSGTISRDRFITQAFSVNLNCTSASISRTLAVAAGYFCFCNCPIPVPGTLYLEDPAHGTTTLQWTASVRTWTASRTVRAPGRLKEPPPGADWFLGCTTEAEVDVPIVYQVGCNQGRQPLLNVLFAECQKIYPYFELPKLTNAPDALDFAGWPLSPSGTSGFTNIYECSPLSYSVEIAFEGNGLLLYPPGPLTFTVHE